MKESLHLVVAEHCYLRQAPGNSETENESGVEDEIFSGWAVRLIPEENSGEESAWVKIETHYGYRGYVRKSELREISRQELEERQDKTRFFRMKMGEADLLSLPKVQGLPLELILKNAVVEVLETGIEDGWTRVRTAAGREGYVHSVYLLERKDDDRFLLDTDESGREDGYFRTRWEKQMPEEEAFRAGAVKSAMAYLGTQYRWGGKSSQGLDCSGLVFMSYLENGVLIYRDARIMQEYPMDEITRENLKPGDAIFFPGHVALYLGKGKYIHSTGYEKTPYVTINSLDPSDEDYREDLAQKVTAYGSIF